jgi:Na+/H+ antiporter NhaD/arsenite permease-like protein
VTALAGTEWGTAVSFRMMAVVVGGLRQKGFLHTIVTMFVHARHQRLRQNNYEQYESKESHD